MQAMKNAANLSILAVWATLGVIFTLTSLNAAALSPVLGFWLWFGGFAAVMTWAVSQLKSPQGALGAHAAAFVVLHCIPRLFPLTLLRLGLDLLGAR